MIVSEKVWCDGLNFADEFFVIDMFLSWIITKYLLLFYLSNSLSFFQILCTAYSLGIVLALSIVLDSVQIGTKCIFIADKIQTHFKNQYNNKVPK